MYAGVLFGDVHLQGSRRSFQRSHAFRPREKSIFTKNFSREAGLGDDMVPGLGGWGSFMSRQARSITHAGLNLAVKVPLVSSYAQMARTGLSTVQNLLPTSKGSAPSTDSAAPQTQIPWVPIGIGAAVLVVLMLSGGSHSSQTA